MRLLVALAVAVFAWVGNAWGGTIQFQYTTLDYPGGFDTQLNGIDGNNIVGNDGSLPGGFLYNGSTFTQIVDPLGVSGEPMAISGNNIVGWYTDSGGTGHTYLYNGSTYTTLNPPYVQNPSLQIGSYPTGISGNNKHRWNMSGCNSRVSRLYL
jgi:hypothetical protein